MVDRFACVCEGATAVGLISQVSEFPISIKNISLKNRFHSRSARAYRTFNGYGKFTDFAYHTDFTLRLLAVAAPIW